MFWSVSDEYYNVHGIIANKDDYIRSAITRQVSESDLALVREALDHA